MSEIIRELDDYGAKHGGSACLVKLGQEYFVVSSIAVAPDHGGPETLAFASDAEGEVTNWNDVAGGRGWSRGETLAELKEKGPDPESVGRGIFGDTKKREERSSDELLEGFVSSLEVVARELKKP